MKNRIVPVLIVMVLVFLIGAAGVAVHIIDKYTPTEEQFDLTTYYPEQEDSRIPLVFGTEILEESGLLLDGEVYLPQSVVNEYLNKRFYWDSQEELMIYTTPNDRYVAETDTNTYQVDGKKKSKKEDYVICTVYEEELYIHVDFVQKFTDIEYQLFSDPSRLVVQYQWEDVSVVETGEEPAAVRYEGNIKSEILTEVSPKSTLRLLEESEDWDQVATEDGFIGYIKKDDLAGAASVITFERTFEEPEYTSISKEEKINLAWHQVTSEEANSTLDQVLEDVTGVNVISPTWFSISDNEGNITNYATESYVTDAHGRGLEVWGLVDNFSQEIDTYQVLSHTTSRVALEENIMSQILRFDLDGVNIDFESLAEETGPHFIQFLRELSILCRKNGVVLSVDNPVPEEFTSHYDRTSQGEVVDYVIIMGYDEHYVGSEEAGSVASLPWVEEGITETLECVPAEKVINGIPFYTRVWKTYSGVVTSEAVGMDAALKFIKKNKIETYWNTDYSQNYGEIEKEDGKYQIWLEDEDSIAEKMKLISKYQLAGVAEWKLGFERSDIWEVISEGLNQ